MIIVLLCLAALWIPGLVILLVSARNAPQGFEDASGFHEIPERERSAELVRSVAAHTH